MEAEDAVNVPEDQQEVIYLVVDENQQDGTQMTQIVSDGQLLGERAQIIMQDGKRAVLITEGNQQQVVLLEDEVGPEDVQNALQQGVSQRVLSQQAVLPSPSTSNIATDTQSTSVTTPATSMNGGQVQYIMTENGQVIMSAMASPESMDSPATSSPALVTNPPPQLLVTQSGLVRVDGSGTKVPGKTIVNPVSPAKSPSRKPITVTSQSENIVILQPTQMKKSIPEIKPTLREIINETVDQQLSGYSDDAAMNVVSQSTVVVSQPDNVVLQAERDIANDIVLDVVPEPNGEEDMEVSSSKDETDTIPFVEDDRNQEPAEESIEADSTQIAEVVVSENVVVDTTTSVVDVVDSSIMSVPTLGGLPEHVMQDDERSTESEGALNIDHFVPEASEEIMEINTSEAIEINTNASIAASFAPIVGVPSIATAGGIRIMTSEPKTPVMLPTSVQEMASRPEPLPPASSIVLKQTQKKGSESKPTTVITVISPTSRPGGRRKSQHTERKDEFDVSHTPPKPPTSTIPIIRLPTSPARPATVTVVRPPESPVKSIPIISTKHATPPKPVTQTISISPTKLASSPRPIITVRPSSSMTVKPSSSITPRPSSSIVARPSSSITVKPSSSITAIPSSSITVMPSSSITVMPSSSITVMPSSSITKTPSSSIITMPSSSIITMPSSSITARPSSSITIKPSSSIKSPKPGELSIAARRERRTSKPTRYYGLTADYEVFPTDIYRSYRQDRRESESGEESGAERQKKTSRRPTNESSADSDLQSADEDSSERKRGRGYRKGEAKLKTFKKKDPVMAGNIITITADVHATNADIQDVEPLAVNPDQQEQEPAVSEPIVSVIDSLDTGESIMECVVETEVEAMEVNDIQVEEQTVSSEIVAKPNETDANQDENLETDAKQNEEKLKSDDEQNDIFGTTKTYTKQKKSPSKLQSPPVTEESSQDDLPQVEEKVERRGRGRPKKKEFPKKLSRASLSKEEETETTSDEPESVLLNRGRGRPRKSDIDTEEVDSTEDELPEETPRPRGRPSRGTKKSEESENDEETPRPRGRPSRGTKKSEESENDEETPRRSRGRPSKGTKKTEEGENDEETPKRSRGRPSKVTKDSEDSENDDGNRNGIPTNEPQADEVTSTESKQTEDDINDDRLGSDEEQTETREIESPLKKKRGRPKKSDIPMNFFELPDDEVLPDTILSQEAESVEDEEEKEKPITSRKSSRSKGNISYTEKSEDDAVDSAPETTVKDHDKEMKAEMEKQLKALQDEVRELQFLNESLERRVAQQSGSPEEVKNLQMKGDRLETLNNELKAKLKEMEKSSEKKMGFNISKGMKFSINKKVSQSESGSSSPSGKQELEKNIVKQREIELADQELKAREIALEKREMRAKALDRELDERAAQLTVRDSRADRWERKLKSFNKELEYKEKQVKRLEKDFCELGGAGRRVTSDGTETDIREQEILERFTEIDERIEELNKKEAELKEKEMLLAETEKQLCALNLDLNKKAEYLHIKEQDSPQEDKVDSHESPVRKRGRPPKGISPRVPNPDLDKEAEYRQNKEKDSSKTDNVEEDSSESPVKKRGRPPKGTSPRVLSPKLLKKKSGESSPKKSTPGRGPLLLKRSKSATRKSIEIRRDSSVSSVSSRSSTPKARPSTPKARTNKYNSPSPLKKTKIYSTKSPKTPKDKSWTPRTKTPVGKDKEKTPKSKTPGGKDDRKTPKSKTPGGKDDRKTPKSKTPSGKDDRKTPKSKTPSGKDDRKTPKSKTPVGKKTPKTATPVSKKMPKGSTPSSLNKGTPKSKQSTPSRSKSPAVPTPKRKRMSDVKSPVSAKKHKR